MKHYTFMNGCAQQAAAEFQHEPYKRQGYKAGDAGAQIPPCTGLPFSAAWWQTCCRKSFGRQARYRITQIQNHHLHSRLFLARTYQLQILHHSKNKNKVVDG